MDPNTLPTPNFEMPRPQASNETNGQPAAQEAPHTGEGSMELPSISPAPPAPMMPPAQQQPMVPIAPAVQDPMASSMPDLPAPPLEAEDSDLIEKAWVDKAKAIVEQTKIDPYQQNKEINKVKAEYIKKRYNKDIKVSDG